MPHYFFHLAGQDGSYSADDQGVFFPDLDAAYLDVHRAILDMSFDMLRMQRDPYGHRFDVADQNGDIVLELTFNEVLRPRATARGLAPGAFHEGIKRELQRSKRLKADLSVQIADAHATIAKTKLLLSRSQPELA